MCTPPIDDRHTGPGVVEFECADDATVTQIPRGAVHGRDTDGVEPVVHDDVVVGRNGQDELVGGNIPQGEKRVGTQSHWRAGGSDISDGVGDFEAGSGQGVTHPRVEVERIAVLREHLCAERHRGRRALDESIWRAVQKAVQSVAPVGFGDIELQGASFVGPSTVAYPVRPWHQHDSAAERRRDIGGITRGELDTVDRQVPYRRCDFGDHRTHGAPGGFQRQLVLFSERGPCPC